MPARDYPSLDSGEQRTWRANRTGVPGFAANECAGDTVGFEYSALRCAGRITPDV